MGTELETRVLLLAPSGRDAEVTCSLLTRAGLACTVCKSVRQLGHEVAAGAGAALVTEDIIGDPQVDELLGALGQQAPWSELPVVVLMRGGAESPAASRVIHALGNVTLLERPAPMRSVVSAVQSAVRGRRRQYQNRDQIDEIRRGEAAIRQSEHALRESEARFRMMANSIPQLAWMARPDGWIFWYNDRWYEFTGTTPQQMEGWGWEHVHDPAELPAVKERWSESIRTGSFFDMTFPLRAANGQFRWFLTRVMPLRDSEQKITMWFGTNTDITDQRRHAQERQQLLDSERAARAEAERAGRLKDEFLSTLSHELRTPLNAILGWAQLLRQGAPDAQDLSQGLETIDRNARAQTRLIEDLLDMSRIISGKVRLEPQAVNPAPIIEAALDAVRPAAQAKRIKLRVMLAPAAGPITADPNRLQQIIWNLLTNAIKFTPRDGTIEVLLERSGSQVVITITDTGEGIGPEFLPYLFERFRQADSSRTRQHGGLGLGLSIVKHLVELHGGTVSARSAGKGKGSSFSIRLPVRVMDSDIPIKSGVRADTTAPPPLNSAVRLNGIKVLVVDDEPDARVLVKRLLEEHEAEVSMAASAAEAMETLIRVQPNVIVSDIGMPRQDGYEFLTAVRKQGIQIPAVALTAFARPEDRLRSLHAGYQIHLSKPVEPAELLAAVASTVGRVGGADGQAAAR